MFTAQDSRMPKEANFAAKLVKIHDIRKKYFTKAYFWMHFFV